MSCADQPAPAASPLRAPVVEFYIPATSSLQERRPRTLKHGDTFGLFDHYGNIVPGEGSPEGLYHRDMRFLSSMQLLINDRRPLLLSSIVQDNNALLTTDLTNPDFFDRRPGYRQGHDPPRPGEVHLGGLCLRASGGAQFRHARA
jgi:N-terminal domain of (some) glycogen debranching enzymes